MKNLPFLKLHLWPEAIWFVKETYKLLHYLPQHEKFVLTNQMQRSAISITSNLAEGAGRISGKDQARFTMYAYSSLMELLSQLIVAMELGYLKEEDIELMLSKGNRLAYLLTRLRQGQMRKQG
ncbi:MAG: four helix bundle protein [Bacteroidetes bacterium]|nr:four helix bundle protein [Bacteroidota bacterium]